jgi:hypothetical protein
MLPTALLAVVVCIGCSSTVLGDPRLERCGVRGNVAHTVELTHAWDFHTLFPEAGLAPELDRETPAVAFVYLGPVEIPVMARGGDVTPQNAVCVVIQGEPSGYVYSNVDLRGFEP